MFGQVSHRHWEQKIASSKEPATYDEMMNFLRERLSTLTSLEQSSSSRQTTDRGRKINDKHSNKNNRTSFKSHNVTKSSVPYPCMCCNSNEHRIYTSNIYKEKSPTEYLEFVKGKKRFNCLEVHAAKDYQSTKTCSSCNHKNHDFLHQAFSTGSGSVPTVQRTSQVSTVTQTSETENSSVAEVMTSHVVSLSSRSTVLVRTALVKVTSSSRRILQAIDPG